MFAQLKALWAVLNAKKEIGKLMEKKDGWKTTEFWVNLIIILLTLLASVMSMIPADVAAKIIAGLAAVYTIARAIVKVTPSTKDDELVARIGKVLEEKLKIQPK